MMKRVLEPEYMDTEEETEGYDAMDHEAPNLSFVERLESLGMKGRVLDVGTGPGHIPLLIASRQEDVEIVGIDAARHMLERAEKHRSRAPGGDRVRFEAADAKGLPYPADSFDAVCSNTVLHHIPDPRPFLAEADRVRAEDGLLLVRDLYRPATPEAAMDLVRLHASEASPYQQELFRASLCAALTPEELDAQAREAGLRGYEITIDSDRHMSLQISAQSG